MNITETVAPIMNIKSTVYQQLPSPIKPVVKQSYYKITGQKPPESLHSEFVDTFFSSRKEYDAYVDEFEQGPAVDLRNEALEKYQQLTKIDNLSGIGLNTARDYYAVTRKLKPDTVIETGVCNGVSTLAILLAIDENESGKLYSIDYPFRADESLEEFREKTFDEYGGAAIPSDKEPGWIIPNELKSHWKLILGKSQRELPNLLIELDDFELFIHDSEHSHPCMMFEYELSYEWIEEGGVILSDDISWNDALSVFTEVREPEFGYLSSGVGYIQK